MIVLSCSRPAALRFQAFQQAQTLQLAGIRNWLGEATGDRDYIS